MSEAQSNPILPTFSWIGHLKQDDRELLSSYGEFFPGHPGNVIIEEGVLQTEVFVVISGELEVYSNREDDTEVLLARVGPGQTIGEISLFNAGPATATVRASEFSQLWRIADADLIQFMQDNPGAGNLLLRTLVTILSQRLRQIDPQAFGLSAYAVVNSPELAVQDAAVPAPAPPSSPVTPVPADSPEIAGVPEVTVSPLIPASVHPLPEPPPVVPVTTPAGRKSLTKTQALPNPDELEPL